MSRSRRPELLLTFLVLVGAASFGIARVRTAETRTIPYQGVLERNGAPVTGAVNARFGLFTAANANTACVATNDCTLWSEEQVINVVDGRFSVLLGDAGPRRLTSAILQSPELFLGVAFKTSDDAGFTALGGTQEIVGAPIVQPGAVTASSLASNTVFSANVIYGFDQGEYFPQAVSPPGWIRFPITDGNFSHGDIPFDLSTNGAQRMKCVTSALNEVRIVTVLSVTPTQLRIGNFFPGGGDVPGDFTIICHGF